jgi:hypothetical protein
MHKLLEFPKIIDPRGNLTFVQYPDQLPFEIKRVFWTYDVPSGAKRGGHAYRTQHEIIIALSGSFDVRILNEDGSELVVNLNKPNVGLYMAPNVWREIQNFSTNSLSLHLSSAHFDESEYVKNINSLISIDDSN